jgi:hypothetical protein
MKKDRKLTPPDWVNPLVALLRPKFVEVGGKVFHVWGAKGADQCRRTYASRRPQTVDENTDNHEHFRFFDGRTREGVHNNFFLAEVVRLAWRDVLRQQFPKKRFRLFVVNEFAFDDDDPPGWETGVVITTLRLWSVDPRTAKDFDATYRPGAASANSVLLIDFPERGLQPLDRVLAMIKRGVKLSQYRKAIASLRRKPPRGRGRRPKPAGKTR